MMLDIHNCLIGDQTVFSFDSHTVNDESLEELKFGKSAKKSIW